MSDIDIQIAQALGYRKAVFNGGVLSGEWWIDSEGKSVDIRFSSSLDLMHELEMMIPEQKRMDYLWEIGNLKYASNVNIHAHTDKGKRTGEGVYNEIALWFISTATAEQRAQAWLKVMKKL